MANRVAEDARDDWRIMIALLIGVLLFFVVASVVAFLAAHVFILWFCITLALVLLGVV